MNSRVMTSYLLCKSFNLSFKGIFLSVMLLASISMLMLFRATTDYNVAIAFNIINSHIIEDENINNNSSQSTVKFYIYQSYSQVIKDYFKSCNASSKYGVQHKNRYSHLGEAYFSLNKLKKHKWYNPNLDINDADIIILPIYSTMGSNGKCSNETNTFSTFAANFFEELLNFSNTQKAKQKYFLMAQTYALCQRLPGMTWFENSRNVTLIVGHFEDKRKCVWSANNTQTNTIVVPYTLPPTMPYNQYKIYDDAKDSIEHFHQRKYSLFFMGSACLHKAMASYYDRRLAVKYMRILNQLNGNTSDSGTHFAVITDYALNKECIALNLCDASLSMLPCGLTATNSKLLNSNNKLYDYGLRHSKFNLMMHGDTPTSGKFYDSIAFNLINIFIGITKENLFQYLPFSNIIPYENFAFFISIEQFRNEETGIALIKNIIYNTSTQKINDMIGNMTFFKKHLLWNHKDSVVVDDIMVRAKNMPLYNSPYFGVERKLNKTCLMQNNC